MLLDSIDKSIPVYLITISAHQKSAYITSDEIVQVLQWLAVCGVEFIEYHYENHGVYSQLHLHGIAIFKGVYSLLTSYGDKKVWGKSFRIHFKRIRGTLVHVFDYIRKQDECAVIAENMFKNKFWDADIQAFQLLKEDGNLLCVA